MKKTLLFLPLILLGILSGSCSGVISDFKYMDTLKDTLSSRYDTEDIHIEMKNQDEIIISFVNSKFDTGTDEEREKMAEEIGAILRTPLQDRPNLTKGTLEFVQKSNYIIASSSSTQSYNLTLEEQVPDTVQAVQQ